MDPNQIWPLALGALKLPRIIKKVPGSIQRWLRRPPADVVRQEQSQTKARVAERRRNRQEQKNQVPADIVAAYERGMKYWKGGVLTQPDKEKAAEWIRIAARGGHPDAQMMAQMHNIKF